MAKDEDDSKKKEGESSTAPTSSSATGKASDYTRGQMMFATFACVSGIFISFVTIFLAYRGNLRILSPRDPVHMATFSAKIEFTARYWIIGLVWLYISLHIVVVKRINSKAINPLSGNELLVEAPVKIFTNSVEQFVISVISQVTVITFLEAEKIISIIPVMNLLYFIGRILFYFGYPKFRSFGMTVTMFPASLAIYFSFYRFIIHWLGPDVIVWRNV